MKQIWGDSRAPRPWTGRLRGSRPADRLWRLSDPYLLVSDCVWTVLLFWAGAQCGLFKGGERGFSDNPLSPPLDPPPTPDGRGAPGPLFSLLK
jgi:hypothetical protein